MHELRIGVNAPAIAPELNSTLETLPPGIGALLQQPVESVAEITFDVLGTRVAVGENKTFRNLQMKKKSQDRIKFAVTFHLKYPRDLCKKLFAEAKEDGRLGSADFADCTDFYDFLEGLGCDAREIHAFPSAVRGNRHIYCGIGLKVIAVKEFTKRDLDGGMRLKMLTEALRWLPEIQKRFKEATTEVLKRQF